MRNAWSIDGDAAVRSIEAGLTEPVAIGLLERLMADCLAVADRCESLDPLGRSPDDASLEASKVLVALPGEIGSVQSRPLLLRLEARGMCEAGRARTHQLELSAASARARRPCRPPTAEQIARARASLEGFVVFEGRAGVLTARAPTPTEQDDLSFLLASTDDAGPAVGTIREAEGGSFARPGPADPEVTKLHDRFLAAKRAGDHAATAASARAFLGSLGFPGPIQTVRAGAYAWAGRSTRS